MLRPGKCWEGFVMNRVGSSLSILTSLFPQGRSKRAFVSKVDVVSLIKGRLCPCIVATPLLLISINKRCIWPWVHLHHLLVGRHPIQGTECIYCVSYLLFVRRITVGNASAAVVNLDLVAVVRLRPNGPQFLTVELRRGSLPHCDVIFIIEYAND